MIRRLRDYLTEAEGHIIEAARAKGITWARLAPALEVKSRQSAERRYLSLRGDAYSDHHTTTRDKVNAVRDQRAEAKAREQFIAEHADDIRILAGRLAKVPDLQQRADAAEVHERRRVDHVLGRRGGRFTQPLRTTATWPEELRADLQADDLHALYHHLWRLTGRTGLDLADQQDLVNQVAILRQNEHETVMRHRWRRRDGVDDQED